MARQLLASGCQAGRFCFRIFAWCESSSLVFEFRGFRKSSGPFEYTFWGAETSLSTRKSAGLQSNCEVLQASPG